METIKKRPGSFQLKLRLLGSRQGRGSNQCRRTRKHGLPRSFQHLSNSKHRERPPRDWRSPSCSAWRGKGTTAPDLNALASTQGAAPLLAGSGAAGGRQSRLWYQLLSFDTLNGRPGEGKGKGRERLHPDGRHLVEDGLSCPRTHKTYENHRIRGVDCYGGLTATTRNK